MSPLADGWHHTEANGFKAWPDKIYGLGPPQAGRMFLALHDELIVGRRS